jgi:predicted amidohydrolase YtcJ
MKYRHLLYVLILFLFSDCFGQMKERIDLIIHNGTIYTLDENFSVVQALAVKNGKIIATGSSKYILGKFAADFIIDINKKAVIPGFIDAHCHFFGYAMGLNQVDLTGTVSFEEVLTRLKNAGKEYPGEWLAGRGWDQNLWVDKVFPDRKQLDKLFPNRPVVVTRIDGHVVLANTEAIKRSGIMGSKQFKPGEIAIKEGTMSGIFSETAADFMRNSIPLPSINSQIKLLSRAQRNCFTAGLTGVADAGLDLAEVQFMDSLQRKELISLRINVMLNPSKENIAHFIEKGPYKTEFLNVRSVKLYADGSLGSRTALLKMPYTDAQTETGILVTSPTQIREICELALKNGYQVNTHAIGDSAVKIVLETYGEFLKGKNNLRWRIEHAQVVDPEELSLFSKFSVIPSVQATHATSDMYWAGKRLGKTRIRWAYAYKDLLQQNGWIANGTDFPIEHIEPLYTFYAAVSRKDLKGFPEEGFQKENALTREEALRSVTIWAAKASFEENTRGSIEPGKFADFVILDKDIMKIPESEIWETKIVKTFVGGKQVYGKK